MLQVKIIKDHNPFLNLTYEQYLLKQVQKSIDDIYLIFYTNSDSIILGKTQNLEEEVYLKKIKRLPVIRRESGGGSVMHFSGNINFAFLLSLEKFPNLFPIQESYCQLLKIIIHSMQKSFSLSLHGHSDLCITNNQGQLKKISGNAQVRKNKWLLHHGTLLCSTKNLNKISYFLQPPQKQPEYRKNRSHKEFLIQQLPQISTFNYIQNIVQKTSEVFSQKINWQFINVQKEFSKLNQWNFVMSEISKMKLK